ncbi:TonB family protein [Pectobacterium carotovorum]|uniref:TonB family protein n=1 Tax=Pectobacterium carotovorum TaxID=554 RepID=UPI00193CDBDE|nr:TonB family protein [Pectobacterium carotovorum]QRN37591.1 TonB family protein [Pectobacterium carotovorum]
MSSENLQGALLGANRTGSSVLLGSRPLAHSYPTTTLTADVPNWRSLAFFVLSCVAHAALALFFLLHSSPKESIEDMAGNAGGSMQVTMMAAAMVQQADSSPPTAESSDPPVVATQTVSLEQPISPPLPEHPNPVIKQPVIERKPITPVTEKKPPVRERKQPEKKPESKPKEQQQATQQQTEKKSESPVATNQTGDAPSPMQASAGMPGSAATAKAGESDSGQAARGAGKSNSQNFRALHRRVNYPSRAKALGVEGKVRVKFDITGSGTVTNVQILSETPDGVFGDDVVKDMARWRYRTEAPVDNQVVSIVFKLNGHIRVDDQQ